MQDADNIIFESRDIEIFNIPDVKTKLNTLQNYFFPRLHRLLDVAILHIREVYKVDPLEKFTFVYRPAHRKDSDANWNSNDVHIGLAGKRDLKRRLKIKKENGDSYILQPSYLLFKILPTGEIFIQLSPFYLNHNQSYIKWIKRFIAKNYNEFSAILNSGKIYYDDQDPIGSFENNLKTQYGFLYWFTGWLKDENPFNLCSSKQYFPITSQTAIQSLIQSFVYLYPILDAFYDIAEGIKPNFKNHFNSLKEWVVNSESLYQKEVSKNENIPELPELDSYKFVRARLWYQVLARDNWTCCSCKRSSQKHGIVLHVDHIKPRSHGGKDELTNLQTLCLKCNIGKSNKDDTDLRS